MFRPSVHRPETTTIDLAELEREAANAVFAERNMGWFWDDTTHADLIRVGSVMRRLDEYGFRTGDLLTHEQLVELDAAVARRVASSVLAHTSEQPVPAWVA